MPYYGPGGSPASGFDFQGEWTSATAYLLGQIVRRQGDLYLALGDSQGLDPLTPGETIMLGSMDKSAGGYASIGQESSSPFQVNATLTVTEIGINGTDGNNNVMGTGIVAGLASDWGWNATIPWLAQGVTTTAGSGFQTVVLGEPVVLNPNTTYRVVVVGPSAIFAPTSATFTGVISGDAGVTMTASDFSNQQPLWTLPLQLFGPVATAWGAVTVIADNPAALPRGGTTGQTLTKVSGSDHDDHWA